MTDRRIALVAAPHQEAAVAAIAARLPVHGLYNPTRRSWKTSAHTTFPAFEELLHQTEICCFLTPYSSLGKDMQLAVASGVHVLCAGPPSLSRTTGERLCQNADSADIRLAWGGQFRHDPLHQALQDQARATAFGNPVFLRLVRGGGNSLPAAGWAACQSLEQAAALLPPITDLHVSGVRRHGRCHLALTVATISGATAQLVVAPHHPSPVSDISLLGTGGLLSSTSYTSLPARCTRGASLPSDHAEQLAEPDWLADFIGRLSQEKTTPDIRVLTFFQTLRSALTRALREGRPIPVRIPEPAIPLSSSR